MECTCETPTGLEVTLVLLKKRSACPALHHEHHHKSCNINTEIICYIHARNRVTRQYCFLNLKWCELHTFMFTMVPANGAESESRCHGDRFTRQTTPNSSHVYSEMRFVITLKHQSKCYVLFSIGISIVRTKGYMGIPPLQISIWNYNFRHNCILYECSSHKPTFTTNVWIHICSVYTSKITASYTFIDPESFYFLGTTPSNGINNQVFHILVIYIQSILNLACTHKNSFFLSGQSTIENASRQYVTQTCLLTVKRKCERHPLLYTCIIFIQQDLSIKKWTFSNRCMFILTDDRSRSYFPLYSWDKKKTYRWIRCISSSCNHRIPNTISEEDTWVRNSFNR